MNGLHQKGDDHIDPLCTDITIVDSSCTCGNHGQMEGPIIMIFTAYIWQITLRDPQDMVWARNVRVR